MTLAGGSFLTMMGCLTARLTITLKKVRSAQDVRSPSLADALRQCFESSIRSISRVPFA